MRIVSAILFDPRGGSADVARSETRCLRARGLEVTLVSGSRRGAGDARRFYGNDVRTVDFEAALAQGDPMAFEGSAGTAPVHPSYEDRPGAPDRVFAKLDDDEYERQVRAWSQALVQAGAREADVLYLHHLTPINEAAARVAPEVPVIGHLHGTEMLMLEEIDRGPPPTWTHARQWAGRLREWAHRCQRLVVVPSGVQRAEQVLGVSPEQLCPLDGGVDVELFAPRSVNREQFWQQVLVSNPQGWLRGQGPGSARYTPDHVARLASGTAIVYCGRYTAVKRLDLLISAFGQARRDGASAGLVLIGGHPGELEGEHPAEIAEQLGVPDVFLAGWQLQDALPDFFSAADAVVLASEREHFGLVLVEAMACGLPAIATRTLGPGEIVDDGQTGWLVDINDESGLAAAMEAAIRDPAERRRRGRLASAAVRERFAWESIAGQLADCLDEVVRRPATVPARDTG
jgi:glycosyltransferase involved in cell wall biosynthesis